VKRLHSLSTITIIIIIYIYIFFVCVLFVWSGGGWRVFAHVPPPAVPLGEGGKNPVCGYSDGIGFVVVYFYISLSLLLCAWYRCWYLNSHKFDGYYRAVPGFSL